MADELATRRARARPMDVRTAMSHDLHQRKRARARVSIDCDVDGDCEHDDNDDDDGGSGGESERDWVWQLVGSMSGGGGGGSTPPTRLDHDVDRSAGQPARAVRFRLSRARAQFSLLSDVVVADCTRTVRRRLIVVTCRSHDCCNNNKTHLIVRSGRLDRV